MKKKSRFEKFVRPKSVDKKEQDSNEEAEDMRLNKYVAHCGVAARRKASEYIKEGLVTVNGEIIKEPGHRIKKTDQVTYQGKLILPEIEKVYILLNKPKNAVTTAKDEHGRRTVLDLIGDEVQVRIYPVGRLDRATTGLLLLTNDGDLAKKLSHPSHEVSKVYQVTLDKDVSQKDLDKIKNGLILEDGKASVDGVYYMSGKGKNEISIELHIGRNRIVRRIFEHLGYEVKHLDRIYYAGLTKKDISRGYYRFLKQKEVIMLKHFV